MCVALVDEAAELGVYAVCVSPSMVAAAAVARRRRTSDGRRRRGLSVRQALCRRSKPHEAALAVEAGAAEIDMVIDIGAALAGDFAAVHADIAAVRAAIPARCSR